MNCENYIELLKKHDLDALDFIVDKYSDLIFRVAYKVLNNKELSYECVNDTLMKIWKFVHKFDKEESEFKNWIFTIAKYTAIDIYRKEKKYQKNSEYIEGINTTEDESTEIKYEQVEMLKIVKKEIDTMSDIDRTIFIRKFYYGNKIKDIASDIGLSENAVQLRILRGRKLLNKKLKGCMKNE